MAALRQIPNVQLYKAVNFRSGPIRYIETLLKLIIVRLRYDPEIYFLGFRGHEIFWPVRLLTIGRKLIFDELMSPFDSLVHERKRLAPTSFLSSFLFLLERGMLRASNLSITDTPENRNYYCQLFDLKQKQMAHVHVGADESMFKKKLHTKAPKSRPLQVLFYGSFLPLHGIDVILEAAFRLRNEKIQFQIIGGNKQELKHYGLDIQGLGLSNIQHDRWLPYEKIPVRVAEADLCLAGSFGKTGQAARVITGKTFQALSVGTTCLVPCEYARWGFLDRQNCVMSSSGTGKTSAEALTEAILWCRCNQASLPEIGRAGHRFYENFFSTAALAENLIPLLSR